MYKGKITGLVSKETWITPEKLSLLNISVYIKNACSISFQKPFFPVSLWEMSFYNQSNQQLYLISRIKPMYFFLKKANKTKNPAELSQQNRGKGENSETYWESI